MGFHPANDIRAVLKERLQEVREERQQLAVRMRELEAAESGYSRALDAENRRFHHLDAKPVQPVDDEDLDQPQETDELVQELFGDGTKEFLLTTMADGQVWTLERLKAVAEEKKLAKPAGSYLGRMLHGALMGMKQNGQVELMGKGLWRIGKKQNTPPTDSGVFQ